MPMTRPPYSSGCCSARGLRADRHDKLLKLLDTGGHNCTPNNSCANADPTMVAIKIAPIAVRGRRC